MWSTSMLPSLKYPSQEIYSEEDIDPACVLAPTDGASLPAPQTNLTMYFHTKIFSLRNSYFILTIIHFLKNSHINFILYKLFNFLKFEQKKEVFLNKETQINLCRCNGIFLWSKNKTRNQHQSIPYIYCKLCCWGHCLRTNKHLFWTPR